MTTNVDAEATIKKLDLTEVCIHCGLLVSLGNIVKKVLEMNAVHEGFVLKRNTANGTGVPEGHTRHEGFVSEGKFDCKGLNTNASVNHDGQVSEGKGALKGIDSESKLSTMNRLRRKISS
jgi:hypothetical protein